MPYSTWCSCEMLQNEFGLSNATTLGWSMTFLAKQPSYKYMDTSMLKLVKYRRGKNNILKNKWNYKECVSVCCVFILLNDL